MKNWWKIQSVRIDALSLRERGFLFITMLGACMALVEVLWLSPAQTRHQQVTERFKAQDAELRKLQDEFKNSSAETGPMKAKREELAAVKLRIAAVNQAIGQLPAAARDATPLQEVLIHFLRRHGGLTLVKTTTLPVQAAAPQAAPGEGASSTRPGLELTVAGPYPELIRYVQTLERALPGLRWGSMNLLSGKQPLPQLTLQVYLAGASR